MNPETPPLSPQVLPEAHSLNGPLNPHASSLTRPETQVLAERSSETNGDRLSFQPSRGPGSSRLPRVKPWTNRRKLLTIAGVVALIVVATAALAWWSGHLFRPQAFSGPTWTVRREKLKIAIVERGSLESAKNGDIICTVRSGTKGSTVASTIKWIVDPGVEIQEG